MKKLFLPFLSSLILFSYNLNASVIYSNITDYTLQYGDYYSINMDNSNENDITFYGDGLTNLMPHISTSSIVNQGRIAVLNPGSPTVNAFVTGALIGSASNCSSSVNMYINDFSFPNAFPIGEDKYIGVKLDDSGTIYYGWVLVQYESISTLIIKSYAYESVPNQAINAGDIGSGSGGGGSGGSSSWIEVRTDNQLEVGIGATLLIKAYLMPSNILFTGGVNWSVVNGSGSASIISTGLLTGVSEGIVSVNATVPSFPVLIAGHLDITVSISAGLINLENTDKEISIYSVPLIDCINIQVTDKSFQEYLHYEISDLMGHIVNKGTISKGSNSIEAQNFSSGYYLLSLYNRDQFLKNEKILINH